MGGAMKRKRYADEPTSCREARPRLQRPFSVCRRQGRPTRRPSQAGGLAPTALRRGAIEDVEVRRGRLHVTPLPAELPTAAARLGLQIDRLLSKVRITRLLAR